MANHRTFTDDPNDMTIISAYEKYLAPGETLETVAISLGVGHKTLSSAFAKRGFAAKVNRTVSEAEAVAFQKAGNYPADYMAAKYGLHVNTIHKWVRRATGRRRTGSARAARVFWNGLNARCETPNQFFAMMISPPHNLDPRAVVSIYHHRIKPKQPILWQLDALQPASQLDDDEEARDMAAITEPDDSHTPQMILGWGSKTSPIKWTDESSDAAHNAASETAEMAHLQSILEDL